MTMLKAPIARAIQRALAVTALSAVVTTVSTSAHADEVQAAARHFNIPAQSTSEALNIFAQQSGLRVLFPYEALAGRRAAAISGDFSPREVLDRLLAGTGLVYEISPDSVVLIRENGAGKTGAAVRNGELLPAGPRDSLQGAEPLRLAQLERAEQAASTGRDTSVDLSTEEIVVTGKPFTDANVDIVRTENDAQAYYIFKSQEIAQANAFQVEDFLKQKLTMNTVASTGRQTKTGPYSLVNLRGVDYQTLVLVNGRRFTASPAPGGGSVQFDLNTLAPSMIERIEVLPSSASAIYGGSAVGGVLNVILKRDFTGGDIGFTYDTPLDTNAPVRTVTGAYGWSLEGGRTHITFSGTYRENDSLTFDDRADLFKGRIATIQQRSPALLYSSTSPYAYGSTPNIASATGAPLVFDDGTPLGSALTYVPAGTSPTTSAADLQAGLRDNAGLQNLTWPQPSEAGTLERESDIKSATAAIRRQMTDNLELIGEVFYGKSAGVNAEQLVIGSVRVPGSSPTNPFQQDVRISAPRPATHLSGGSLESTRVVAGFVMDLPYDWRAQGDYTWNRTKHTTFIGGRYSEPTAALASGALNLFVDSLLYADQSPYITANYNRIAGSSTLDDFGVRVSGPIGHLPAGEPNLTLGVGYRQEQQEEGSIELIGVNRVVYLPQSQDVTSVYAEALVPLVSPSNAVPGIQLLDLQMASRVEDFSVTSGTPTRTTLAPDFQFDPDDELIREKVSYSAVNNTLGLRYKPIDSLTFRASYATAFLPPGFSDLLPGIVSPTTLTRFDPRRGNEAVELSYIDGGNPDLEPLEAKTWNVGLIFEPSFAEGLRMGVEWFRLERSNLIFSPSAEQLLADEGLFPGRVTRAPAQPGDPYGVGPITFIDLSVVNASRVSTEGVDLSLGYRHQTAEYGTFSVDLLGTIIDSFTRRISLDGPEEDIAGEVANGGPLKVRANATLGWTRGPWTLSWTTLYYGPYDQFDNPLYTNAGGTTVSHQTYHNFLGSYRIPSNEGGTAMARALSDVTVSLGVRNVFDTMPPFDPFNRINGLLYHSAFGDSRLRSVQLSVGKRF